MTRRSRRTHSPAGTAWLFRMLTPAMCALYIAANGSFNNRANSFGKSTPKRRWRPLGDSNPCYRRERAVS